MGLNELMINKAFVNGQWIAGTDTFDVVNPATGTVIEKVTNLTVSNVHEAVDVAYKAWSSFKVSDVGQRAAMLEEWYRLIMEHKQELAEIITLVSGQALTDGLGEVDYGASSVVWIAVERQ